MIKTMLLFLLVVFSHQVSACRCEYKMKQQADDRADFIFNFAKNVFTVKILASTKAGDAIGDNTIKHKFSLVQNFKGRPEQFEWLQTGSKNPTSCTDDGMIVGQYYLVFTNTPEVFDCSVLHLVKDSAKNKELLNELQELSDNPRIIRADTQN